MRIKCEMKGNLYKENGLGFQVKKIDNWQSHCRQPCMHEAMAMCSYVFYVD